MRRPVGVGGGIGGCSAYGVRSRACPILMPNSSRLTRPAVLSKVSRRGEALGRLSTRSGPFPLAFPQLNPKSSERLIHSDRGQE